MDKTPGKDSEFTTPGDQGEQGHMDLLTTVMHEIGHAIGRDHAGSGVMDEFLATGDRQSPAPAHGPSAPVARPAPKAGWLLSRFYRR